MAGAGGGASGAVSFPAYMQTFHSGWLGDPSGLGGTDASVAIAALQALASTPYDTAAYDPDTVLAATQTRWDTYNTVVTALDHDGDWEAAVGTGRAKVDEAATFPQVNLIDVDLESDAITDAIAAATTAMASANVTAQADAHETRMTPRFLRSVSRFAGGMLDINAVNSSAFIIGLSLLEHEVLQDAAVFDAEIAGRVYEAVAPAAVAAQLQTGIQRQNARNLMLANGVNVMMEMLKHKAGAQAQASAQQAEINRIKIVAKKEQSDEALERSVEDTMWDLKSLVYGGNFLAAISGAPSAYIPKGMSQARSALGGALSGAAMGATVGGPIGAGLGALVGGIGGLL